jgi:predicted transposase/invertase (TIGR01784 family)
LDEWIYFFKKGEIKGKAEGKMEIAKNLLHAGVDIDVIIKSTGLSNEEIQKLS